MKISSRLAKFLKDFYENKASTEDHQFLIYRRNPLWERYWHRERMETIIDILRSVKGDFLEVGCAEGLYVSFYAKNCKRDNMVVGLDLSKNYIRKARSRYREGHWVVGDIQRLPFQEGSFETVLCTEVLEHILLPEAGFHEVSRVSKKYTVITVPAEHIYTKIRELILNEQTRRKANFDPLSGHISQVKIKDLLEWSKKEKLNPVILQEEIFFPLPLAHKLPGFTICLSKVLRSFMKKIPEIPEYGLYSVLLAERK